MTIQKINDTLGVYVAIRKGRMFYGFSFIEALNSALRFRV